jgi:hypothetical protein
MLTATQKKMIQLSLPPSSPDFNPGKFLAMSKILDKNLRIDPSNKKCFRYFLSTVSATTNHSTIKSGVNLIKMRYP